MVKTKLCTEKFKNKEFIEPWYSACDAPNCKQKETCKRWLLFKTDNDLDGHTVLVGDSIPKNKKGCKYYLKSE